MAKKGQAALEFLTTYGWAFLIILVMIGALVYFGVLRPQQYLPDRCVTTTGFTCYKDAMLIQSNNAETLKAKLTNQFGENIIVTQAQISSDRNLTTAAGAIEINGSAIDGASTFTFPTGETYELIVDTQQGVSTLVAGDKAKITIKGKYYTTVAGAGFQKDFALEFYGTVQP